MATTETGAARYWITGREGEDDKRSTHHRHGRRRSGRRRRRRRLSLLVKIEGDPLNTQHAQHRPVQATDR